MAIGDDFSIAANGDIRHVSGTTVYSDLDMHVWLQELADDGQVTTAGDEMFIMKSNPSSLDGPRSAIKPMFLNLLGIYNIDANAAQFINFGSVTQNGGDDLFTGVRSIGAPLVAGSPIYIVQDGAKITKFWPDGHIQVMVQARSGGVLIDNGDARVYSRKYGQTYSDFAVNLVAGGEQSAAISTQLTDWTPLDLTTATALTDITITPGDVNFDTGDGNGSLLYKGTITLANGRTIAEAAQYCQAICDENSAVTINGVEGWQYRALDAAYTPNAAAPFGAVAGGKWFVAQGWLIQGALPSDLLNYQMVSDSGVATANPVESGITIGDCVIGGRLTVGRDAATESGFDDTEYTLNGALASGDSIATVTETVRANTPPTGYIRINEVPYEYTAVDIGAKTFTISGTFGQAHADLSPAWSPYIDRIVTQASESSDTFIHDGDFTARVKMRKGNSPGSIRPFETTFNVGASLTNGTNVIANPDE